MISKYTVLCLNVILKNGYSKLKSHSMNCLNFLRSVFDYTEMYQQLIRRSHGYHLHCMYLTSATS